MAGTLLRTERWEESMAEGIEMGRAQEPSRKSDPGPMAKSDDELCRERQRLCMRQFGKGVCADVIQLEMLK